MDTVLPTIATLWQRRVTDDHDKIAILVKRDGEYASLTWNDVDADVRRAADLLLRCGIDVGDRVAQLSENRYEWIVVDLACHLTGAIHVPMHASLTGQQASYQINDAEAKVVFVSDVLQVAKLRGCRERLPRDVTYFAFDAVDSADEMLDFRAFASEQHGVDIEQCRSELDERITRLSGDSPATILYTSGTTGEPKGVVLTQTNLVSNATSVVEAFGTNATERRINFLPLSHIFARTCDLYTWVVAGSELVLAESRETIIADCQATAPTMLNGVPYFFDKIYRTLVEHNAADNAGAVRGLLGGNVRFCCSGGAPLPQHLFDFYLRQDVPVLEGYGLTESSPVITLSTDTHYRRRSAGKALPGVEIRIADDGEILTRGPQVMQGYYKDDVATTSTIQDGWLHTGDIGRIDDDGFLFITGRKKEIIVTAAGKNVAPTQLEALLVEDPLISQAVVIGDNRSYLSALIVPDVDTLHATIESENIAVDDTSALLTDPRVRQLYEQHIAERLAQLSHYEQVRAFMLIERGFTVESGELTAKLSLRRTTITSNYVDAIQAMYAR